MHTFELQLVKSIVNANTGFIQVVDEDGNPRSGSVMLMEARPVDDYSELEAMRAFYVHSHNAELNLSDDERALVRLAIVDLYPGDGFFGPRSACHIDSADGTDTVVEIERDAGEVTSITIGINRSGKKLRCTIDLTNGPVNFTKTILKDTDFMLGLSDIATEVWNQQA
jgi:hypothetical protein